MATSPKDKIFWDEVQSHEFYRGSDANTFSRLGVNLYAWIRKNRTVELGGPDIYITMEELQSAIGIKAVPSKPIAVGILDTAVGENDLPKNIFMEWQRPTVKEIRNQEDKFQAKIEGTDTPIKSMARQIGDERAAKEFFDLVTAFVKENPCYFDTETGIWWLWSEKEKHWKISTHVDILRVMRDRHGVVEWLLPQIRSQMIKALEVVSCNKPKAAPNKWVQFKDTVVDITTGEEFPATSEWLLRNPIPHALGDSSETPTIDRLFESWVGAERVQLLKEITAYTFLSDYPIHRLFCFLGEGLNGKGSYVRLLWRLLGDENATSFSLGQLKDKFQSSRLFGKLVGVSTELDYGVIEKTDMIKRLTGQDPIPAEFKGTKGFDFFNYAKVIVSANGLPTTTDRTVGFYRRWLILDFPNRFKDCGEIVDTISDEELSAFCRQSIGILKSLLERGNFYNEGDIEERRKRYEGHSNPLKKFLSETTEKDSSGVVPSWELNENFAAYCKQNGHRGFSYREVGLAMANEGYENSRSQQPDGKKWTVWLGLRWKITPKPEPGQKTLSDTKDTIDRPFKLNLLREENGLEKPVQGVLGVQKSGDLKDATVITPEIWLESQKSGMELKQSDFLSAGFTADQFTLEIWAAEGKVWEQTLGVWRKV